MLRRKSYLKIILFFPCIVAMNRQVSPIIASSKYKQKIMETLDLKKVDNIQRYFLSICVVWMIVVLSIISYRTGKVEKLMRKTNKHLDNLGKSSISVALQMPDDEKQEVQRPQHFRS